MGGLPPAVSAWSLALIGLAALILASPFSKVMARWKPEYANMPPEVRQWYRDAELMPAAQINDWE